MATEALQDELRDLLRRQDEYVDDTFELLTQQYSSAVRDAIDDLRDVIDEMGTDGDGRLEADATSVAEARIESRESFTAVEAIWERWSERLSRIEEMALGYYAVAEGRSVELSSAEQSILQELKGLWPDGEDPGSGTAGRFYQLSEHHRRELADAVTRHTFGRARRSGLVEELADKLDRSTKQAEQLFRDSTIQFSRSVNARKADDLDYEWFEYIGPLDSITRPFCRPLVGHVFSRQEIDQMDNGQTGDVMVSGGGYNCRHHWRPVRRSWFDDDEWAELRAAA